MQQGKALNSIMSTFFKTVDKNGFSLDYYNNMKLILKLALNAFALLVVSYLVPGFSFDGAMSIIVTAIVIGVINTFIKPVLQIIFLPLSIVTLGISAFLINVLLLWCVSFVVRGFHIESFFTAVIASVVLTLVSIFLNKLADDKKA